MKGNEKVIGILNEVLKAELTAINQYFLHAKLMEDRGYRRLAAVVRNASIGQMKYAEDIMERILFLEGAPSMDQLFELKIGDTVKIQIENDLAMELAAVLRLNNGISTAISAGDNSSRDLLESILKAEEEHLDFLETQIHLIEEMGIDRYLAQQLNKEP